MATTEPIRPPFTMTQRHRLPINIGCLMDIPTAFFSRGQRGETLILGGLGTMTGVTASGNIGKTTFMEYMGGTAAYRMDYGGQDTSVSKYDTEENAFVDRSLQLLASAGYYPDRDVFNEGKWRLTCKKDEMADVWFEHYKEFINLKKQLKPEQLIDTPLCGYDGKEAMRVRPVSITMVDSLSDMVTKQALDIHDKVEIDSSEQKMVHMNQGLIKHNMLMAMPALAGSAQDYIIFTGQYKSNGPLIMTPGAQLPVRQLQHMKIGDKIAGCSPKFFLLLQNCWHLYGIKELIHKETKTPYYPESQGVLREDSELNCVSIRNLRSKSGSSGVSFDVIMSQRDGVQPTLTEFHYLKENRDFFGFHGSNTTYKLDIYPDVALTRTTVRQKLRSDAKLARAINITADLAQMHFWHPYMTERLCSPKELFEGIKQQGYDWDEILGETRGWYTFPDNYDTPLKFLSIVDLMDMRIGKYKPYWKQ